MDPERGLKLVHVHGKQISDMSKSTVAGLSKVALSSARIDGEIQSCHKVWLSEVSFYRYTIQSS